MRGPHWPPIIPVMHLPDWLEPFEVFKALAQLAAVALGVFLGWRLNGSSRRRDRISESRATWASATEDCLSAWENDQRSFAQLQAGQIELLERMERVYFLEDTKARLRAATMRLVLLDPSHSDDPLAIEAAVLGIDKAGSDTPAHRLAAAIRLRLRGVVDRWTRRKAAAAALKESVRPGAAA